MKEEKTITSPPESNSRLTPFEVAEFNAATFVGSFLFLQNLAEMSEQYQALLLVIEELKSDNCDDELAEVFAKSELMLLAEKEKMEEGFACAAENWYEKFGHEA